MKDVMLVASEINECIRVAVDKIRARRHQGWYEVANEMQSYFEGANVFIASNALRDFINSDNPRSTLIGEILYEFYNSNYKERDVQWVINALTASMINVNNR